MENKNNHLKRILLVLISVLLVFSSIFSGCSDSSVAVNGTSSKTNTSENSSDLNYVSLNEGFTDVVVKDEKSALEAIASVADMLGIEDVDKELKICNVNTVDGDSYYRFQQYYNDIPVHGKTVVIAADENGNATDLTSNYISIYNGLNHDLIDKQKIFNNVSKYLKKNINKNIDIISAEEANADNLYIYFENMNYRYVYILTVITDCGPFTVYVNANNGEVIYADNEINYAQENFKLDGQIEKKTIQAESDNGTNYLKYKSKTGTKINALIENDGHKYDWYEDGNAEIVSWKDNQSPDGSAVDAIANVTTAYNYYLNTFGYDSFDNNKMTINVYVHTSGYRDWENKYNNITNNAFHWISPNGDVIAFTERYDNKKKVNEYSSELDVVGHEYTHGVVAHTCRLNDTQSNLMPGAINEGVADILGYCIEADANKSDIDWTSSVRTSIPQKSSKNSKQIYHVNDYNKKTNECHTASTIISYSAYLMWNGIDGTNNKKINKDVLEKIWYKSFFYMQSDATFSQCANSVYKAAKSVKGITDKQLDCVKEAFEKVGVNVDYNDSLTVKKGGTLFVYDTNLSKYGNYHLTIKEYLTRKNGSFTRNNNKPIIVDTDITDNKGYIVNLEEGIYEIELKDNDSLGSKNIVTTSLQVRENTLLDKTIVYTDFGHTELSDFTIPKDMTLTLGEVDVIEPETVPADATGYSIKWTSSDESVATVTPSGEECIVTSKGKGTATITGELVSNGKTITKSTNVRVASQGRDTVLVLDISGSMSGTPIDEMKKSAINFCNELLADEYNNRVGLVLYDDSIDTVDLTNDLDSLINYIESISSGGTTNMQGALAAAGNMLDSQGKDDNIKNVVVMADGLPNEGETSDTGKMSQLTQYSSYPSDVAYANGVINSAENIMSNYNMYSLGFFHDLSGVEKDFAVDLMKFLTNMPDGYHQVDTAENLQFAFGDIQETISDGSKVVINIACPVDVSVTYNGETLSSAQSTYSDTASFGTLQLLGKNKDIKVLSLDPSAVYDIQLNGTGSGTMNYSVNYLDDSDAIIDYRTFESIPITSTTKIDSNTNNSAGEITLNLDENGDGTVDKIYSAAVNSVAELTYGAEPQEPEVIEESEPVKSDDTWVTVMIAVVVVIALVGIILTVVLVSSSNKKKNPSYNIPVIEPKNNTVNKGGKITVISGSMSGKEFNLDIGKGYIIGKDSSKSQIVLAYDYGKVSREHCVISYDDQTQLYSVIDMSSNGTYYIDNKTTPLNSSVSKHRLNKNVGVELQSGCVLILGDEDCRIVLN